MNVKQKIKIITDVLMTLLLFALMGYFITGSLLHEIFGAAMYVLWIIHHVLNINWYKALPKGKYTPQRIMQIIINSLLIVCMTGLMFSGIVLSEHVFSFIHINSPISAGSLLISVARIIHLVCSYWGFVLMSLHFGLHWGVMLNAVKAAKKLKRWQIILLRVLTAAGCVYGVYALIYHKLFCYLFAVNRFVFFDYERSRILFFVDYLCIMILFAAIAYYCRRWKRTSEIV